MEEAPKCLSQRAWVSYPMETDSQDNVFSSATKREDIGVVSFRDMALNLATSQVSANGRTGLVCPDYNTRPDQKYSLLYCTEHSENLSTYPVTEIYRSRQSFPIE